MAMCIPCFNTCIVSALSVCVHVCVCVCVYSVCVYASTAIQPQSIPVDLF